MATGATVKTSITVSIGGDGDNRHLSAEIDNRPDGLNDGKSSFRGGDPIAMLVYASKDVVFVDEPAPKSDSIKFPPVTTSSGTAYRQAGKEIIEMGWEEFTFTEDSLTASLNKPIRLDSMGNQTGLTAVQWDVDYTSPPGALSVADDQMTVIFEPGASLTYRDSEGKTRNRRFVVIARVKYETDALVWKIQTVPKVGDKSAPPSNLRDSYQLAIHVRGTVGEAA
jgi:hypothetical protein